MHRKLWNKDYILLLQGNAVSAIGDVLYSVAIGYWVYEKTGSSALMGIMSSVSMFVTMFLSPFAGSIVDKCSRKLVIVGMDVLRSVIMLAVGALAFANALDVPVVLLTAFLAALCSVFFSPAVSTLMLDIIPHDDMVRGQSVHSGIVTLVNLTGKALSGVLVAFLGVPLIVVINGVCYLFSAFTELFIYVPRTVQEGNPVTAENVMRDFKTALTAIFSDRFMKLFMPSVLILNLLGAGPFSLMLPFCLDKGFTVDMYGYLMSVNTAASLIAVLVLGMVKLSPRVRYWVMGVSFTVSCGIFAWAYLSGGFFTMCVLMFLGGLLNAAGNAVFGATMMLSLPEENRGAILGFMQTASVGGSALSAVVFGFLGEVFPLDVVFAVGSVISLAPMAYLCFHPKTKEFVLTH